MQLACIKPIMRDMRVCSWLISLLVAFNLHAADPLFDAIRRADTPAVKRLLDNGSSADTRDSDNIPVLLSATLFAGADSVKLLLDPGAMNAATGEGATALMWAMPDLEKARLLVARGADVNAKSTSTGRTPLLIAAGFPGTVDLLRFLLEKRRPARARQRRRSGARPRRSRFRY